MVCEFFAFTKSWINRAFQTTPSLLLELESRWYFEVTSFVKSNQREIFFKTLYSNIEFGQPRFAPHPLGSYHAFASFYQIAQGCQSGMERFWVPMTPMNISKQ